MIGIELDITGRLACHGSKWQAWFGEEYEESEAIETTHKHETEASGWYLYSSKYAAAVL